MKILILLVIVVLAHAQGLTFNQIQQDLVKHFASPFVGLMFVYDSATQMGPLLREGIDEIAKKKEGHFEVYPIDCNSDDPTISKEFPYCSDEIRPKLPILFFKEPLLNLPQSGEIPNPKSHNYAGNLQQKSLYDFAVPLMKLFSVNLKKVSDWKAFEEMYPQTPKVLYFTDKDRIPPFFKTLTAHFRNTIAFGHVFKNSSLCEEFGITEFPTLLMNGDTKIQMDKDLHKQIKILKEYEGQPTKIVIQDMKQNAKMLEEEDLQEKIYDNPRHILVHIPGKDGKPHNEWKKAKDSFKRMFDYFETDSLATKLGVKHRPAIIYFPKSLAQKDVKKTVFHPTDSFRTIYDDVSSLIQDFTIPLASDQQMQKMTSLALSEDRLMAVLFHKDDISLSYRVLSNDQRFKEQITFIRMKDPAPDVMKKFNLKKLPALFIMLKAENETEVDEAEKPEDLKEGQKAWSVQIAQYTGKFNYDDLENYLKYFVTKPEVKEESISKVIEEYRSKKKFDSGCVGQNCYLLLLDNSPENVEKNQNYISVLRKNMGEVLTNVGFIDATCHSEVLAKLEIQAEELPALVYLNAKFQKYSRLIGRIEDKSIESFKTKIKGNKGIWRNYDKIEFQNKNCEKEHQKIKQLETSGSELTEEEAAILEEIRMEEEKKKQQAVASGGQDSKKRKKKRRPKEEDSQL